MEGTIDIPKDISLEFKYQFHKFIDPEEDIYMYFKELLSLKRAAFSLEIAAPVRIIQQIEQLIKENGFFIFNDMDFVDKGDESEIPAP